ncbi:MAG: hypothetical protein IJC74_06860 [Clostridia bacterium]|nr:hypothetical protein [Clostridia bacterium]
MSKELKIGYIAHWVQPPYKFVDFLKEQGIELEKIDITVPGYLENYNVVIIEQNGFNDDLENDELYVHDWVKRGGILAFMHQDYKRWAPYFLPQEVGYVQLIHRYIETINGFGCSADPSFTGDNTTYMTYMMPWIEKNGKKLFSEPEIITPDEMFNWKLDVDTFGIVKFDENHEPSRRVRTTAQSCFLANPAWEVLGSFMDTSVKDGSLILCAKYGEGMFFLNQILFPEILNDEAERCLAFWRKYSKNLMAYFKRFLNGEDEEMPADEKKTLPLKKNYKLAIHMHSLDWYGCDAAPGTINALMRYMGYDICALALKDIAPYKGNLNPEKYSDDKVLFLDGQEYHPFNYKDKYGHISPNTYHMLAIGIDPDAYTLKYTCSRFSDKEIAEYLKEAIDYVHEHNGAVCATHPDFDYWYDYGFDAVDKHRMGSLSGTDIERYWLMGKRIPVMNSVDLFGSRRIFDNPAVNFIYLDGNTPCRDNVVKAIRSGNTIAAAGFDEADIMLNEHIPGEEVSYKEAENGIIFVHAKVMRENIKKIRVYSGENLIYSDDVNDVEVNLEIPLKGLNLKQFIRVELEGFNEHWICNSTPFYLK